MESIEGTKKKKECRNEGTKNRKECNEGTKNRKECRNDLKELGKVELLLKE